ncbi:hypothetical protein Tco_0620659 [Tanacetum coccineum]
MGIMLTKTELALEQTQQGVSDEVLNIRVILLSIHNDDGNPTSANIKQALRQVGPHRTGDLHKMEAKADAKDPFKRDTTFGNRRDPAPQKGIREAE